MIWVKDGYRNGSKGYTQSLNVKFACYLKRIENETFERSDKTSLLIEI